MMMHASHERRLVLLETTPEELTRAQPGATATDVLDRNSSGHATEYARGPSDP